ncbi:MAG: phosphatidate cytidylyltransferase [Cyanobacteria bacterium P01_G01_bin.38]
MTNFILFFSLGGIGLYCANRKVNATIRQQRWLKFLTYIIIVSGILASIFLNHFYLLASLIAFIGLGEIFSHLATVRGRLFKCLTLVVYLATAFGFVVFTILFSPFFLGSIYFQVVLFDGFCQVVGQLLDKHKLVPQISPGKTVEGLIGGTLFCLVAAVLARGWVGFSISQALLMGMTTALLALVGDILASYLKRLLQVKDYSRLLPGHGGVLDRFDSLMMVGLGYTLLAQIHLLPIQPFS